VKTIPTTAKRAWSSLSMSCSVPESLALTQSSCVWELESVQWSLMAPQFTRCRGYSLRWLNVKTSTQYIFLPYEAFIKCVQAFW